MGKANSAKAEIVEMIRALILSSLLIPTLALADPPPGTDLDSPLHKWFETQHNAQGGWCCQLADGKILESDEWRITDSGTYQVFIVGNWQDIQPYMYRNPIGGPNPTGKAIVWYRIIDSGITIFCFTPGNLE